MRETHAQDLLAARRGDRNLGPVQQMGDALATGNVDTFVTVLNADCHGFVCENLNRESRCRAVLQALRGLMTKHTISEKHSRSDRSDHEVVLGNTVCAMEVRYNQGVENAWAQLLDRQYGREYEHGQLAVEGVALDFRHDPTGEQATGIAYHAETLYDLGPVDSAK